MPLLRLAKMPEPDPFLRNATSAREQLSHWTLMLRFKPCDQLIRLTLIERLLRASP